MSSGQITFPALARSAHPGEGLLSPEQWVGVAEELELTPREWEVSVLLFEGKTRESIARRLQLSTRTVRKYLEQLHDKLSVNDRVGLVLRIVETRDFLTE